MCIDTSFLPSYLVNTAYYFIYTYTPKPECLMHSLKNISNIQNDKVWNGIPHNIQNAQSAEAVKYAYT